MQRFSLWAPNAKRAEIETGGERLDMTPGENGWWFADVYSAGPGSDYAFVLDGSEAIPDPRSLWQPTGIYGPSRVVDHGAFSWTDKHWQAGPLSAAVLY